ncbi:MAG: radical SAM protein [Bacteroidales bacterium]
MNERIRPFMVYGDGRGNIFEDTQSYATIRFGNEIRPVYLEEMIEIPEGTDFFELPGHYPVGSNSKGEIQVSQKGLAVSLFLPPAYTLEYLAAWKKTSNAPVLPLFAYAPVAWYNDKFYTCAIRIDSDIRQDVEYFDHKKVKKGARAMLQRFPGNKLVKHVVENCALKYNCPAGRNFVLNRWEAPLPCSPTCNADCIGCISYQDGNTSPIQCTQPRLNFRPTAEDIAEMAVYHLSTASRPIVSFGQGCEGEPLMEWKTIEKAILLIRQKTNKGIINLNTNGSKPDAVSNLCRAGLNSIRISMNSAQEQIYYAYHRPKNYTFGDVVSSLRIAIEAGIWTSINYFTLAGFTDTEKEVEAICNLIEQYPINMIQWRNFNIDADWLFNKANILPLTQTCIGVRKTMEIIKTKFPRIRYGYYNPYFLND